MTCSIIGCGNSGKDWFNTPCDLSIGVNDCAKFGRDPDWLVLVNRRFTPEREKIIKATKAKRVLTSIKHWKDHFKNAEEIRLQPFGKHLKKGHIYSSKTSPFIAMSLAFNAGATDIILFGVDLKTHPVIKDKILNHELRQWELFTRELKKYKVNVWVSSGESALSKFLPVWTRTEVVNGSDCKSDVHQFDPDRVLDNHFILDQSRMSISKFNGLLNGCNDVRFKKMLTDFRDKGVCGDFNTTDQMTIIFRQSGFGVDLREEIPVKATQK